MADEYGFTTWGFGVVGTGFVLLGRYIMGKQAVKIDNLEKDLATHRLYVAENYIKKDVVDRIHERLDKTAEKVEIQQLAGTMNTMQDDIKTLLSRVGNGKN